MPDRTAIGGDGYALAYAEARRTLDEQGRAVAELRTRAGALIATAALTTSSFGAPLVGDGGLGVAAWVAIAAFRLSAVLLAIENVAWLVALTTHY